MGILSGNTGGNTVVLSQFCYLPSRGITSKIPMTFSLPHGELTLGVWNLVSVFKMAESMADGERHEVKIYLHVFCYSNKVILLFLDILNQYSLF